MRLNRTGKDEDTYEQICTSQDNRAIKYGLAGSGAGNAVPPFGKQTAEVIKECTTRANKEQRKRNVQPRTETLSGFRVLGETLAFQLGDALQELLSGKKQATCADGKCQNLTKAR